MTSGTTEGRPADGSAVRAADVSGLLRAAGRRFGDRPALISSEGSRTWAELDRAADAGAAALAGRRLVPGSRVVVSLEMGPDIIAALFAVARAGLVAVPIGPNRVDLTDIVHKVAAEGAIAGQSDIPVDVLIRPAEVAGWWHTDATPTDVPIDPEDIAVLARAASSDRPVMVSHRAIVAAVGSIAATPRLALRAEDRAVLVLPAYHLAGWVTAFLPLAVVGGAAVIPDAPTDGRTWLDTVLTAVRQRRVTIVPGAPSLYRRLRTASGVERAMASVRLMTSGAAPLNAEDSVAMRAMTGQAVWEGYGISESASVVSTSLMTNASRPGSVGLPLSGLKVRIVGDDGVDLYADVGAEDPGSTDSEALGADAGAAGEVGRIQISGPTLFSGYWPDGADGVDDEGWFATGDLGYLDDVGELHLVDRATETIRVAGFTVYPREIEGVLMRHPYVRDAAVIGVPGRAGDAFAAVLVPMWGTHPTSADLDEFVAARLPVFKRPRTFHLVDRLPRNEIGRIDRDAVRALYRASEPLTADDVGAGGPAASPGAGAGVGVDVVGAGVRAGASDLEQQAGSGDRPEGAGEPAVIRPEPAAGLDQLGTRLPGTGERDRRGDQDTDDDLF